MVRSVLLGLFLVAGLSLAADEPTTKTAPRAPKAVPAATHPEGTCSGCHEDVHLPAVDDRSCETCHNELSWTPTFSVEDHAKTKFPLEGKHPEAACNLCHTGHRLTELPLECNGCHIDRHRGKLGGECQDCHTVMGFKPVPGFDHTLTGFTVDGQHSSLECASCHEGANGDAMRLVATATCSTCHPSTHAEFAEKPCTECHETEHATFASGVFDHRATSWPLERRHKAQDCAACHPVGQEHAPSGRCMSCHEDPHSHQAGLRCEDCHRPDRWNLTRFDHDMTGWALRGRHNVTPCADCHTHQRWIGISTECWDCHAGEAAAAPANVPAHRWVRSDCSDCHNSWTWR